MLGLFLSTAYAQEAAAAAPSKPGMLELVFPFLAMFVVFYIFSIRPQQKKVVEQKKFLEAIKPGDQVITSSGILGQVIRSTERIVTLQIDNDVRIRVLRSQIMGPAVAEEGKA
jgi:preprotein translocase subunit YajC